MAHSSKGGSRSSPVHYYIDNHPYFITAATYQHQRLLDDAIKPHLLDPKQCWNDGFDILSALK